MVQETRGDMSLLSRRGQIPGPTPVAVPQRKNHVAELLSRLTLSTASSRAKADSKRSPAINGGHYFGQGIAPCLDSRGLKNGSRPVIGRPTPIHTPSNAHNMTSVANITSVASVATSQVTVHAEAAPKADQALKTPEKKRPTAITTSRTRSTSAKSPLNKPTPIAPTCTTPTRSTPKIAVRTGAKSTAKPDRQSPYRHRKVVGNTSALGRASALRNQVRNQGFSRVQELKLKVSELERVMSQAQSDKELINIQAARIRELEEQLQYSDDQSLVSVISSAAPFSPKMRRVSQISSIDKWEQQEQTLKEREERIKVREDRVTRADTQAKLAQADAKAAVAEKEAMQHTMIAVEEKRKHDLAKLESLYEELDTVKISRDNLQRQVTAFQVSQRTLEKQLKIAQRDAQKAKRAISSLETNVNDLRITIEEKNMENDELNRSITRVMQQAASVLRPSSQSDSTDGLDSPIL